MQCQVNEMAFPDLSERSQQKALNMSDVDKVLHYPFLSPSFLR